MSAGHEEGAEVGPLISPEAKARVERLIQSGADQVLSTSIAALDSHELCWQQPERKLHAMEAVSRAQYCAMDMLVTVMRRTSSTF